MTKKVLAVVLAVFVMLPCGVSAASKDEFEGHWELNTTRTVIFASDGGTYIRPLEMETGTMLNLDEYIPVKDGYIFDGWYSDPRTKIERVKEITLNENTVVYAKWIDDGTVKGTAENELERSVTNNTVVFTNADTVVSVPVTELWVNQNARLEALMQIYNQKFNN